MARTRAALVLVGLVAVVMVVVSGGSPSDPHTPPALPGLPPPFLGTAVVGDGGLMAAIDSYGDVVDLRAPGPAGRALVDSPLARQRAGSVPFNTGIVPRVSLDIHQRGARGSDVAALPLWRADSIRQHYLPGTNVLRTEAKFGDAVVSIEWAAQDGELGCTTGVSAPPDVSAHTELSVNLIGDVNPTAGRKWAHCDEAGDRRIVASAVAADRRWIARARPLGPRAPRWAVEMHRRSLLALRALTDRSSGAVAAGARDGWAYVWPRDAGATAIALAGAGFRPEARRVARFLRGLDLGAAARFDGTGRPVPGRPAQGDAWGWTAAAAHAAGLPPPSARPQWRNRADYQEKSPGDYLANAIASDADGPKTEEIFRFSAHRRGFWTRGGLVREVGDASSGLDSAAAWAVRPFPRPVLFPAVRRTLDRLLAQGGRFGIVPSEDWPDRDPWTAPTAWSAWSFATLAVADRRASMAAHDRGAALRLLGDLRRAATPTGLLPERVDAHSGLPTSTTPLAWSEAFAVLALRQLWPEQGSGRP